MALNSIIMLSSGHKMPIIGIDTCLITEKEAVDTTLTAALAAGCRLIHTAYGYTNQHLVGESLEKLFKSGKYKREDLFIVDKLPNNGMESKDVKDFFTKSSTLLKAGYIDLYLIHSPISTPRTNDDDVIFPTERGASFPAKDDVVRTTEVDLLKTWKAMESLVDDGLARSIGLTNFNSQQIQLIYDGATIKPCIVEVECHAYLPQVDLQEFCTKLNIKLTANCPLGKPDYPQVSLERMGLDYGKAPNLLEEEIVVKLANRCEKSSAQILLRYLVQRGIVPIPRSTDPERIMEYMDIFDFVIDETGMELLESLKNGYRYNTLDYWKGIKEHKHYPFKIDY